MKTVATYSPAVKVGDFIFVAGTTAIDRKTGKVLNGTIEEETEATIRNLKQVLQAAGTSLDNVVKATVYITDWNDYKKYNEVYAKYFGKAPPARATIGVAQLYGGLKIEIEAVAIMPPKEKTKIRK